TAVARHGAGAVLHPDARARVAAAHRAARALVVRGAPVYGRTTGVGALLGERVGGDVGAAHDLALLRSHAAGTGEQATAEVSRAMIAVRANQLAAGGAGVSPGVVDALVAALDAGLAPAVRRVGAVGTGDLTAMAEAGLALIGEGRWLGDAPPPAPARLEPGDALALMSSNALALGEAALAADDCGRVLNDADAVAALSFEVVGGEIGAYDARVQAARPHPGQVTTAARLRGLLGDSRPPGRRLQDPLSLRCVPQVHGAARDALAGLQRVVTIEVNAAAENPLVVASDGIALHNGNFAAVGLGLALDQLVAALLHAAALSARRLAALLDTGATGLPAFLATGPAARSGLLALEYTAHATLAELRAVAAPVALPGAVMGGGAEDHASFAGLAARQAARAAGLAATVLGVELTAAVRALRLGPAEPTGPGTRAALRLAAGVMSDDPVDRPPGADVDAATRLVLDGSLTDAATSPPPVD
ncbi:MAG: aromatic amino acid lyase, partial [Actinobacteria bacterium]|nr:aromatic amino acid lyase [Actinomycetota bacterium]